MINMERSNRRLLIKNSKLATKENINLAGLAESIQKTQELCGPADEIGDFIREEISAYRNFSNKVMATMFVPSLTVAQTIYLADSNTSNKGLKIALCGIGFIAGTLASLKCDKTLNKKIDSIRDKLNIFRINRGLPTVTKPNEKDYPEFPEEPIDNIRERKKSMRKIMRLNQYNPYDIKIRKGA